MEDKLMNEGEPSSKALHALRSGAIIGGVAILLSLLMYITSPASFAKGWVNAILFFVVFGMTLYFGIQYRKQAGGYLSFKGAFLHGFIIFTVSGLIWSLFNLLLFRVIDPGLARLVIETTVDNSIEFLEKIGVPDKEIDKAIVKIEEDMKDSFTMTGMIKKYLINIIFYVFGALISGLIVRKKEPETDF